MTHGEALKLIETEHQNAVKKHGSAFKDLNEMIQALYEEVEEVDAAIARGDYNGPHGVKKELAQVAAVCIKALKGLKQ